jgi:hypothetical protein
VQRDLDLVRRILLAIEEQGQPDGALELDGVQYERVADHVAMLVDAGLLTAADATSADSPCDREFIAPALTADGHDFLAEVRDETTWSYAKAEIGDELKSSPLDSVGEMVQDVARRMPRPSRVVARSTLPGSTAAIATDDTERLARGVIFVSCSQFSGDERKLHDDISAMVRRLTPFEPFSAPAEQSFHGVPDRIFAALRRTVGFISVLHPRGTVMAPDFQPRTRASVWCEQELAIAAYLSRGDRPTLRVAPYVHRDVCIEGVRAFDMLNPVLFSKDADVLADLERKLPPWSGLPSPDRISVEIRHTHEGGTSSRLKYRMQVVAINHGTRPIDRYHLVTTFPAAMRREGLSDPAAVGTLQTFDVSEAQWNGKVIQPEGELPLTGFDYYWQPRGEHSARLLAMSATATLWAEGLKATADVPVAELVKLQS